MEQEKSFFKTVCNIAIPVILINNVKEIVRNFISCVKTSHVCSN